jgi:predicted protein tyrosine phosphatase
MTKSIAVRSYLAASYLLLQEPNTWDAIVILDSDLSPSDFVERLARRHLYLRFDDVAQDGDGKRAPAYDDIRRGLEFAKAADNLLVCCRAGQSRSAALGLSAAYQCGGWGAALGLLNPMRHAPHALVVALAAKVLGRPELVSDFNSWRQANCSIRLIDYLHEIEAEAEELERQGATNHIVR